jgi:hypothetical protein
VQFWKKSDYFSVTDENGIVYDDIIIERPPEPEDINWGNLGLTNLQKFFRLCFTILVTIIMIGISFVIVYSLSTVQRDNQNQRFISILISLAISVINLLIISTHFLTIRSDPVHDADREGLLHEQLPDQHSHQINHRPIPQLHLRPHHGQLLHQKLEYLRSQWPSRRYLHLGSSQRFHGAPYQADRALEYPTGPQV